MNVARILYPVEVLGPGKRIALWLAGCGRGCPGCSNPELWHRRPEYELSTERLLGLIRRIADTQPVQGFTLTGGEPMDQAEALAELLPSLRRLSEDILIYSGYRLEALVARGDPATDNVLRMAAVLIDGPYLRERNDGAVLRGSSNQRIHILDERYAPLYRAYMSAGENRIQNFMGSDGIISVGIHHPGFVQPGKEQA